MRPFPEAGEESAASTSHPPQHKGPADMSVCRMQAPLRTSWNFLLRLLWPGIWVLLLVCFAVAETKAFKRLFPISFCGNEPSREGRKVGGRLVAGQESLP